MQERREGGQGVSEEIQGEQQRAIAYPSKLPLTSREGRNAVAERSCAPQRPADAQVTPALFPTETSPDETSPTDHLAREQRIELLVPFLKSGNKTLPNYTDCCFQFITLYCEFVF